MSEKLKHFRQKIKLFSKSMGYYKLSTARYVTKFGIIIQNGRGNDIFVCFVTCESVYRSFLAQYKANGNLLVFKI